MCVCVVVFGSLFLNNYNTFLYMANYYIVIPTANQYSSILGMSSTMSGLILVDGWVGGWVSDS